MASFTLLTKESYEKIKNELNYLKTVKRAEKGKIRCDWILLGKPV